ncbi:MAG: DUF2141 domain-containing protein [Porphyromonas sp.]|nr:DUF2141 domain-containing protein [Porphyromonas sp.]
MKTKITLLAFALLASLSITAYAQHKLSIQVKGIETQSGNIMVGLFNNSETFLKKPFKEAAVAVIGTSELVEFDELESGAYAVSIFHDENGNGELDRGEYGIPLEKFGFSNNVIPKMGPPSFEECKINIESDTQIEIKLISIQFTPRKMPWKYLMKPLF